MFFPPLFPQSSFSVFQYTGNYANLKERVNEGDRACSAVSDRLVELPSQSSP